MRSRAHLSVKSEREERKGREFLHAIAVNSCRLFASRIREVEMSVSSEASLVLKTGMVGVRDSSLDAAARIRTCRPNG